VMRTSSTNQPAYRERRLSSRPTGSAGFPAGLGGPPGGGPPPPPRGAPARRPRGGLIGGGGRPTPLCPHGRLWGAARPRPPRPAGKPALPVGRRSQWAGAPSGPVLPVRVSTRGSLSRSWRRRVRSGSDNCRCRSAYRAARQYAWRATASRGVRACRTVCRLCHTRIRSGSR
jgi:hypothetical protein